MSIAVPILMAIPSSISLPNDFRAGMEPPPASKYCDVLNNSCGGTCNILLLLFSKIELSLPITCRLPEVDNDVLAPEMISAVVKSDIASGRVGKLNNLLMGSHHLTKIQQQQDVRSMR
jgi:hypothetical protein